MKRSIYEYDCVLGTNRRFRLTTSIIIEAAMMEVVGIYEMSANFHETTVQYPKNW